MASTDGDRDDEYYEWGDDLEGECDYCGGDGFDPLSDYVLPCPYCGDFA